jgi:hypothetical protein
MNTKFHFKWALIALGFCFIALSSFSQIGLGWPPARFQYPVGPHCQHGPNVLPGIQETPGQGVYSEATGNIVFANNVTGEVNMAASFPGTWVIKRHVFNDSFAENFTILPSENASFDYLLDTACIGTPNPLLPIITGTSGGTFHGSSGSLVIDTLSGAIDLLNTTMGLYIISYSVEGQCPRTQTDTLMIHGYPDPFFSFGADQYCMVNGSIVPDTISLPSAGYYSYTGGTTLVIDPNTAQIQLAQSAPGIYYIGHYLLGGCPTQHFDTLEIVAPFTTALFEYADSIHCLADPTFLPIIVAPNSVTFSGSGILINNPANGAINPADNTVGTFVVTAYHSGVCAESWSQTIQLVDSSQVTLTASGDSLLAPGPGSNYQWYLNGVAISGANDSTYFAATSGNYEVRYHRVGDECGTIGSLNYVGVAQANTWLSSSKFFPNPSNGQFNYEIGLQRAGKLDWELRNALGNLVTAGAFEGNARQFAGQFDFSSLPSGTYLLRLKSKEGAVSEKIVLQH